MEVKIDPSWEKYLKEEFEKPYFKELAEFVKTEYKNECKGISKRIQKHHFIDIVRPDSRSLSSSE